MIKTLKKAGKYVRVDVNNTEQYTNNGWEFCEKSEWKKNVRDVKKEKK